MAEVTFCGEQLHVPDELGLMPLVRFAQEARFGLSVGDVQGLAAMGDLLDRCIAEEDRARFEELADKHNASGDQLWQLVQDVFEVLAERPTSPQSDSSGGLRSVGARSTDDSSLQVEQDYVDKGRPDMALIVRQTREFAAAG